MYLPSRVATSRRMIGLGVLALAIAFFQSLPAVSAAMRQEPGGAPSRQAPGENERMPLFGKITAVHDKTLELSNVNGETVTVKITDKTEFRKDRQAAKRSDFKVGDVVVVRGEENADHTWTAEIVGARSMNGPNGSGGFVVRGQNGTYGSAGTLGKDFVTGEIKSIDAPKLTVLRPDNVTQTFELNEDTSLRKGRESVTMADIQVGDHVFARGALQNDAFVPKMVVVIGPEQWKRMQEMGGQPGGPRRLTAPSPNADPQTQKPREPQR
jgi:hypothetical protein